MEKLKEMILTHGIALDGGILKVDAFLNHQISPPLMKEMGDEFARRFQGESITKILTVESSGIAPAVMTGLALGVDVVFARKKKSFTMDDSLYTARIMSFTKGEESEFYISKKFLNADDKVLIIDDFLANGQASLGLAEMVAKASATLVGIGIVIEKSFQNGRKILDEKGIHTESLARIKSLDNNTITFL